MKPLSRQAPVKGEKLARRLACIMALLHQGQDLDKHALAEQFEVDVRTIERDLGERLHGIAERDAQGRWQLALAARGSIPARHLSDYATLAGTQALFPDPSLSFLLAQLQTPVERRPLKVQAPEHEDLRGRSPLFDALYGAIRGRHECRFTYRGKPRHARPYRLIHRSGIWYLAALDAGMLKNFSLALIESLQVDEASRFEADPAHEAYIDAQDGVWFTASSTEVLLRVAPQAAHYFSRRALLPHQQQRDGGEGSLLVSCRINHPQQLLPIVRYWLPHVRILRPLALHEALVQSLGQALEQWQELTS